MNFQFVLLIVLFSYLRRSLQTKTMLPQWDRIFYIGMMSSIAFLVLESSFDPFRQIGIWIAHLFLFGIIYLVLTRKEFLAVKSVAVAVVPLTVLNFFEDFAERISPTFYNNWNNYFETANVFAFIWLVSMLYINNRQRKALEKEKLKAADKEKEFQAAEALKAALEVQVAERTAELMGQKTALENTLEELKATQDQLIQSEKMASLGELTAGIAHEIQNPLNFVNNFSEVNAELIAEMQEELDKGNIEEVKALVADIASNEQKINLHGKRADAIVKGMLQHSRSSNNAIKEPTNINALADEYLRLAYHGLRAKDKSFNATMKTDFDEAIGSINVIPQDIGRVILNLITNAFYAVAEKKKQVGNGYEPTVTVLTKLNRSAGGDTVSLTVQDNGNGIPVKVMDKIFQPFFTTKPTGQGTGLGLSMSYEIVTKGHGGELKVINKEGIGIAEEDSGAAFTIILPA